MMPSLPLTAPRAHDAVRIWLCLNESETLERLGKVETVVEPNYYPRIKGATGIFRVKPEKVENRLLVEKALAGEESLSFKIKPADFASYLIKNTQG